MSIALHHLLAVACVLSLSAAQTRAAEPSAKTSAAVLFDGQTLAGWEGDPKWWRVADGALAGGSLTEKVPRNFFLATERSFHNFDLRLKLKLTGVPDTGMINSGIQIRSVRVPGSTEMSGYQVDAGDGWWGKLYDESRRNKVIAQAADLAAVNQAIKPGDWNEFRIRAEGPRIQSWINGVPALDYTETEPNIAQDGHIGVQIHSGGMALVQVKDVVLTELPPTPNAPTWDQVGRPKPREPRKPSAQPPPNKTAAQIGIDSQPRTPEEQRKAFTVPDGFEVELVAAETEGVGKFITVVWDARGRMWTMTALEYPMDANETPEASRELFARGGRDQVLVFDDPYGAPATGPARPRIFASGLAIPLGLQPYRDGALVQYGPEIRFYRDRTGDGRADDYEVVLTGFGTQDSHLFPHQFLRAPGGWIYVAQGLFNYSKVRRPDGTPFADGATEIPFNQCKLARFRPDGSLFENLTAGPNNIWGLVISREGEMFLQEANDLGYPVAPFEPGAFYRTGSPDRLRPYQPLMPPTLMPPQMGGTGLSGLALADDRNSPFVKDENALTSPQPSPLPPGAERERNSASLVRPASATKLFYLANPITSRIQIVQATPENGRYRYEKLPDFLTSEDPRFRPVAVHFGPDGCLYIVDWYNKIISHNEVPRAHPERDKTRGRIWRVRHRDQPRTVPPDLTALDDRALLAHLGASNALIAQLAWQEIVDRNAAGLVKDLADISGDKSAPADRRLGALWALEGVVSGTAPAPGAVNGAPAVDPAGVANVEVPARSNATGSGAGARRTAGGAPALPNLLRQLAADGNANIRREAIRIAVSNVDQQMFTALATPLLGDPHPRVRAALGDALRRIADPGAAVIALMAKLGRGPLSGGDEWDRYDREFERYLARWAMELHPEAVAAFLDSPEGKSLPLENRVLATLALAGRDAAIGLARLMPDLPRPLADEEVRVLASHFSEPAVAEALGQALGRAESQAATLGALLKLRTSLETAKLDRAIAQAAAALWQRDPSDAARKFVLEVAGAFRVSALEPEIASLISEPGTNADLKLAGLRALREMNSSEVEAILRVVRDRASTPALRHEALAALASSRHERAPTWLLELWPSLDLRARSVALERLSTTQSGAKALLASLRSGAITPEELGASALEKMHTLLPGDPQMEELWRAFAGQLQRVLRLNGGTDDFVSAPLTLAGPFTVETWVKLAPDLSNHDGLLAAPGQFDLNFHASQLRVWVGGGQRDIVVAKRKTTPELWTHYAVTRDEAGVFRIYINGELEAVSAQKNTNTFSNLNIGRTSPNAGGTEGWLSEYRVWNVARTPEQIRDHFDQSFHRAGGDARVNPSTRSPAQPSGLIHCFSAGAWGKLSGNARVEPVLDAPALLTVAEARARQEKFSRFRALAETTGNVKAGNELFTMLCLTCHQQGGQGGQLAPPLDGIGLTGTEALLRNILTPNAAMEGGYRQFRVETRDGELLEGLLVSQDDRAIVLRQVNVADQRIARSQVKRAGFTHRSIMPEGLLEALSPEQVSDLFAYLKSLR